MDTEFLFLRSQFLKQPNINPYTGQRLIYGRGVYLDLVAKFGEPLPVALRSLTRPIPPWMRSPVKDLSVAEMTLRTVFPKIIEVVDIETIASLFGVNKSFKEFFRSASLLKILNERFYLSRNHNYSTEELLQKYEIGKASDGVLTTAGKITVQQTFKLGQLASELKKEFILEHKRSSTSLPFILNRKRKIIYNPSKLNTEIYVISSNHNRYHVYYDPINAELAPITLISDDLISNYINYYLPFSDETYLTNIRRTFKQEPWKEINRINIREDLQRLTQMGF